MRTSTNTNGTSCQIKNVRLIYAGQSRRTNPNDMLNSTSSSSSSSSSFFFLPLERFLAELANELLDITSSAKAP